jgi:hypothetical protein
LAFRKFLEHPSLFLVGSPQIRFLESVTGTGMRFLEKEGRYTWMKLDPVPSDAKELVFRIRMSFNDKPEESLGP